MTPKTRIETPLAPPPMPVFSQGVRKGPLLAVSGQGGGDPATGTYPSLDDVIMLRCYLTTREHFPAMNAAYTAFLAEHLPHGVLPSRTTVFVGLPLPEMLVEIDALAVIAD